jgi:ribosomal protein S18 acetylase RimI-like enzyme
MLGYRFTDIWVYELHGQVVAFVILVSKPDEYQKEKRRLRPGVRILLYVFAKRPWFLAKKILGRVPRIFQKNLNYIHPADVKRLAGKAIWVNYIAVLPEMQNKAVGSKMIKFCEQRACELECDSIRLRVNIANNGSIRFHERLGFMKTGKQKDEYTYMKSLHKTDG